MIRLSEPVNKVTGYVEVVMEPTYHYTYNLVRVFKVEVTNLRSGNKSTKRYDRNYIYIPETILKSLPESIELGNSIYVEGSLVTSRVQKKLKSVAVLASKVEVVSEIPPKENALRVQISGVITSLVSEDNQDSGSSSRFQVEVPLEDGSKYVLPRVSAFGKLSRNLSKYKVGDLVYVSSILYSYKIKGARISRGGSHVQYLKLKSMTDAEYLNSSEVA